MAVALALRSLFLALVPCEPYLSIPVLALSNALSFKTAANALWLILGGGALAILLGHWKRRRAHTSFEKILVAIVGPLRRAALVFAGTIAGVDGTVAAVVAAATAAS